MKKCLVRNDFTDLGFTELCSGINLLCGTTPLLFDENGKDATALIKFKSECNPKNINNLAKPFNPSPMSGHIDIMVPSCTILYDLKKPTDIDRVQISGFYNGIADYGVCNYELYLSNDITNLFTKENCIIAYDNSNLWKKQSNRNHADQVFDLEDYSGRYFAVKILKANPTDNIIRLSTIALFNHEYSEQNVFCRNNFEQNYILNKIPTVKGTYTADLSYLTDGICFDENKRVCLTSDTEYTFKLDEALDVFAIYAVGSGLAIENCMIYMSTDKDTLWDDEKIVEVEAIAKPTSHNDISAAEFRLHADISCTYIGFKFKSGDFIDELGVLSKSIKLSVLPQNVLNDDFVGFGVNCLPMALMNESKNCGYNEVYWEIEKSRIINTKPSVVRFWFQPDWIITNQNDYNNGIYNFDSEKMQSVYKYLNAFLEAGSEIELNFGWKASKEICNWFNFEGSEKPWNSAPKNLESFAKCCSATLKELVLNRKYTNIKYLTFYNEPNYGTYDTADFNLPSKKPDEYYCKLYLTVMEQLEADGLLSLIEPWGAEQSGPDETQWAWTGLVSKNLGKYVKKITQHRYCYSYDELMNFFSRHNKEANGKSMIISEYGVHTEQKRWDCSQMAYSMAVHNCKYSGALLWTMSGVFITDPCSFLMNNDFDLWKFIATDENAINEVNPAFYETCLQMRYIPNHSKSIDISKSSADIRAAAWKNNDDFTILIESKSNHYGRCISLDIPDCSGKTFYKHTYKDSVSRNGNAIICPCEKTIALNSDTLMDEIDGDYQMVMYTTIKPKTQVTFEKIKYLIQAGDDININASLIDDNNDSKLCYEISAANGEPGKIDENGHYTADKKAKPGDMIAVKAYCENSKSIFGTALIVIK